MAQTDQDPLFLANDRAETFISYETAEDNPELLSKHHFLACLDIMDSLADLDKAPQKYAGERVDQIKKGNGTPAEIDNARKQYHAKVGWAKRETDRLKVALFEAFEAKDEADGHPEEELLTDDQRATNLQYRYNVFERTFGGAKANKVKRREDKRQELKAEIDRAVLSQDPEFAESLKNRDEGVRPHKSDKERRRDGDEQLWTWGRINALMQDPRARFYPATHREKNTVLAWLDYLDNPQYELGVNNQLFEVIIHQQKGIRRGGEYDYRRAVESIAWEIGDYAADAARAIKSLRELGDELAFTSKDIVLGQVDEVADDHPGYAALFRHLDIKKFFTSNNATTDKAAEKTAADEGVISGKELLRTAEDRWLPGETPGAGKHKTVHSRYTHPTRVEEIEDRFEAYFERLDVKKARWAIEDAAMLEQRRFTFMLRRLIEISDHFGTRRGFADVASAADKSIDKLGNITDIERLLSRDSDSTDRLLGQLSVRAQKAA